MLIERYNQKLCDRVIAQSTHLFESICGGNALESGLWMDCKKLKLTKKRENTIYIWIAVYQQKMSKRYICMLQMLISIMTAGWV